MEKTNKLPSAHQVGDKVNLNLFESGFINNCEVVGVKFNAPKVYYDIAVLLVEAKKGNTSIGGDIEDEEAMYTVLEGVDSICVVKPSEFKITEPRVNIYLNLGEDKSIKSFVSVGDVIEVEHYGSNVIYRVDQFEVIPNSPHLRPIDFVILVTLTDFNGGSITCTSDNFKYIRHINKEEQPLGLPLDEKLPNFKFTPPTPKEIEDTINVSIDGSSKKERILDRPAAYSLIEIFKEIKFGRPAASQQYLQECIEFLEKGGDTPISDELIRDNMGKPIFNNSHLRPYNRIGFLSSQEGGMDISQLDEELSKIVFKYAQSHMMKKDLELSIRIMEDIIRNPQFYLVD